jgi:hypothetical protein
VGFPTRGQIFQEPVDRVKASIAQPSIDTFYQVSFSFGNYDKWLGNTIPSGSDRVKGLDWQRKLSLLCAEAEIPGTSYETTTVTSNRQGIEESFPIQRNFPDLNLGFYVDADHVVVQVLESWMLYINPMNINRKKNAYGRFRYPDTYKEILHITKYERDTFNKGSESKDYKGMMAYEFVNVWPTNLQSMKVAYGESNVLRCNLTLAYDRYFADYNAVGRHYAVESTPDDFSNRILKGQGNKNVLTNPNRRGRRRGGRSKELAKVAATAYAGPLGGLAVDTFWG